MLKQVNIESAVPFVSPLHLEKGEICQRMN